MQIVIDISEKIYNALTHTEFDANLVVDEMRKAIANGTPLPEHHGDLKDEREVVSILLKYAHSEQGKRFANFLVSEIKSAPTIIEADKTESEG